MTSHSYGTLNYFGHILVFAAHSLVEFVVHQEDQKAERRQKYVAGRFRRDPTELGHLDHVPNWYLRTGPSPLATPQFHATDLPHVSGHERLLPLLCAM